ncbi:MAG: transglutaminase domain-containing protein, partial [Deltaproteobacteria bacterium]|nr:transglutaminase domain-containing protein [Deltaproteobacteria bacterium]
QTITVVIRNAQGNSASQTISVNVDSTPPQLVSLTPASGTTLTTLSFPISGSSNERLASATFKGQALTLAPDGLSFSGTFTASSPGALAAPLVLTDLVGNSATTNVALTIALPPPVILSIAPADNTLFRTLSVPVSGQVDKAIVSATANGQALTVAPDGVSFSGNVAITAQGAQNLTVVVVDAYAGSATRVIPIKVDSIAPQLVATSPASGSTVSTLAFTLSGTSNESLSSASFGGQPMALSADGLSFSIDLTAPGAGALTGTLVLTDVAGNAASFDLSFNVQPPIPFSIAVDLPQSGATLSSRAIAISGSGNRPLATATVNGQPLTVSGSGFSGTYNAASVGPQTLVISATSTNGASASANVPVTVTPPPPEGPVLASTLTDHLLISTATPALAVPVTVTSNLSFNTTVSVNGVVAYQSAQASFTANVVLALGKNTIQVDSVDSNGGESEPLVYSDIVYNPPANATALAGSTLVSPAFNVPTMLSDAFLSKTSAATAALAALTHRTDPVSCAPGAVVAPPVDLYAAVTATDAFSELTPEIRALAASLVDADGAFYFVRDQISFLPRFGLTQTAAQTLSSRAGTALDKANALATLLRAMNVPVSFVMGDVRVPESALKSLYGVEGTNDLGWAHLLSLKGYFESLYPQGFDAAQMLDYVDGQRVWRLPHAWLYANLEVLPGNFQWISVDPSYPATEYELGAAGRAAYTHTTPSRVTDFLFTPDIHHNFVKSGTFTDYLVEGAMLTDGFRGAFFVGTLPYVGFQKLGASTVKGVSLIPGSVLGAGEPCVKTQAQTIPDDYVFKSFVRAGQADHPLVSATLPLALVRQKPLSISHSIGLWKDINLTAATGTLLLASGDTVLSSADNVPAGAPFELYHGIQEPLRYGGAVEARLTPNAITAGVQVISHSIAPVGENEYLADVAAVKQISSASFVRGPRAMAALLKLATSLALLRAAQNDVELGHYFGTARAAENLIVTSTRTGTVVDNVESSLGMLPTSGQIDWEVTGPLYSRSGDFDDLTRYVNVTDAKGAVVIADSSAEHELWADLFGASGVSAVKAIQKVAEHNANLLSGQTAVDLIRGGVLSPSNKQSLYNRFAPAMQAQIPFLDQFAAESPYLFSLTDQLAMDNGWSGVAFIIAPSTPMGQAGAFIGSAGSSPILGGDESSSSSTCSSSGDGGSDCTQHGRTVHYDTATGTVNYSEYSFSEVETITGRDENGGVSDWED